MFLIGIGMFFDGFDIYLAGTVLGVTLKTGFSTLPQNAMFISATFVGMMLGSFATGFLGDRYGRRFTYQFNLLVFGLASLAAAFAPNMTILIACRFVMGFGLGAENVVGYSTMTEFVPAKTRGKWLGLMAVCVVTGLPVSLLVGITGGSRVRLAGDVRPRRRRRAHRLVPAQVAAGIAALAGSVGRTEEAEALMQSIEKEAAQGQPLPAPAAAATIPASPDLATLFTAPLLSRMIVGSVCLITINTLLYGFVTWLPVFFIKQGTDRCNLVRIFAGDGARRTDRLGHRRADRRPLGPQADHHRRIADLGRAWHHLPDDIGSNAAAGGWLRADGADLCAGGAAVRNLHPRTVPDRSTLARLRDRQHARPRRHHRHAVPGRDAVRGARCRRRDGADDRAVGGADRNGLGARHRAAAP
jgi:MFS family permease